MAIIQQGTADGSVIGNPSAGDFYVFNDSNNGDAYTRRDSSGTDIILGGGAVYGSNLNTFAAAAEVNTSAPHTTWVNSISDTTTALIAGDYELTLCYGWNHNASNSDFESRILFDGSIVGDIFGNGTTHKQEPKDSAGSGGGSGTSQQLNFSRTFPMTLTAGVKTVVFDFRSDDSTDLSTVWDVYIKLIRIA